MGGGGLLEHLQSLQAPSDKGSWTADWTVKVIHFLAVGRTEQWLQENLGYSCEMMAPVDIREPVPVKSARTLPPYNG